MGSSCSSSSSSSTPNPRNFERNPSFSLTCREMRLPKRIILVRHGQSLGNIDERAYGFIPDWKIPLTSQGKQQACLVGQKIRSIIGEKGPCSIYFSPYIRTKQTLAAILGELPHNPIISIREEPRVTEQQFGNMQVSSDMIQLKADRSKFGRFYYRFPEGESGLDVYSRVSSYIGTLFREWGREHPVDCPSEENNIIIVTHGLTLRLFLMRWFQLTVEEFEASENPENGDVVVMTRHDNMQNRLSKGSDETEEDYRHLHVHRSSKELSARSTCTPNNNFSDQGAGSSVTNGYSSSSFFLLDKYSQEKMRFPVRTTLSFYSDKDRISNLLSEAENGYNVYDHDDTGLFKHHK